MQARSVARGLLIGALAAFALLFFSSLASAQVGADASAVQGQNGSTGAAAASGPVIGGNAAVANAGPTSGSLLGTSQSQQLGNNTVAVNQSTSAKSGDAVAGSQVTGVVGGGKNVVQNSNSSIGAVALTGPAIASNTAVVNAGPASGSLLGSAQVGQVGNNTVAVNQESEAVSGDAVAGSQVTGIVGGGATVQNMNSSLGALSISGPACASFVCGGGNNLFVGAGPKAASLGLLGPNASAAQFGDNEVVLSQSTRAKSGDALSGAQVTGAVGKGDMVVQNSNSSRFGFAFSGPAVANSFAVVNAGPTAFGVGFLFLGNTQVSQTGDNVIAGVQETSAESGDALAGSQVTGLVSSEIGSITVMNQQSSDFDFAVSGLAAAASVAPVFAGPTAASLGGGASTQQFGDNVVDFAQGTHVSSGDALAGSSVTGVVGGRDVVVMNSNSAFLPIAISGPAAAINIAPVVAGPAAFSVGLLGHASASQFGSNIAALDQQVHVSSGDALAGSQSTGVVGGWGRTVVMNSNSAFLPIALTSPVLAANVAPVFVGPTALSASLALGSAQVSQFGDNRAAVAQGVHATTGDAVAGSQVTGVVGGADIVVANQNSAILPVALSGPVITGNLLFANVGPTAASFSLLLGHASASQFGNNDLAFVQDVVAGSGDAVAGSQVTGAVAGIDPVIMNSNASLASLGLSGLVLGGNTAGGGVGPTAVSPFPFATTNTSQAGNSSLAGAQAIDMESGDGVSGSQVSGAVVGGGGGAHTPHHAHGAPSIGTQFATEASGHDTFGAATTAGVGV